MAANIDTMMYVGEKAWHNLGTQYQSQDLTCTGDIIKAAQMDWGVGIEKMKADGLGEIPNYHAVYREDNNYVLGVVNRFRPELVQNIDALRSFESILNREVEIETAASLGHGENIFACFKINEGYTVLDDAIDHYFVVMNDHTKSDGKVTILNTPIRVVCQNTLATALATSIYKTRVAVTDNDAFNAEIARKIIEGSTLSQDNLEKRGKKLYDKKISRDHVEAMLDELFPLTVSQGNDSLYSKANEVVEMKRDTFLSECMGRDDLGNYRGTQYQIYQALVDYEQHYYAKLDKSYDLNYRMGSLPGVGDGSRILSAKYLKIKDKLIA